MAIRLRAETRTGESRSGSAPAASIRTISPSTQPNQPFSPECGSTTKATIPASLKKCSWMNLS